MNQIKIYFQTYNILKSDNILGCVLHSREF